MVKSSFGKDSQFGWEIDHILSISRGGKDNLRNLQPLHWKNNEGKADDHPNWICVIKENSIRSIFYKEDKKSSFTARAYQRR
jgi:hypothetical protein